MVAQIHATEGHVLQAIDVVQRRQLAHTGLPQLLPARPLDEATRTQRIHHHPASHATACGSGHCIGNPATGAVVQPDVESDMHTLPGLPYVCHQPVDGGAAVHGGIGMQMRRSQQGDVIAGHCAEAIDGLRHCEQRGNIVFLHLRGHRQGMQGTATLHLRQVLPHPLQAPQA